MASEGISQADVERSTRDLGHSIDNLFDTAMRVKAERDELLELVKRVVAIADWNHDYDHSARREYEGVAAEARAYLSKAGAS